MANVRKNNLIKEDLERRLTDVEEKSRRLREVLPSRITTEDRRALMEQEFSIQLLQLENMELEHTGMMHERVVKDKELQIRKLLLQVN